MKKFKLYVKEQVMLTAEVYAEVPQHNRENIKPRNAFFVNPPDSTKLQAPKKYDFD